MELSVLCLLTLALAFVPQLSATVVKQGCPAAGFNSNNVPFCTQSNQIKCNIEDDDCEGGLKCCFNGCDNICRKPLREKINKICPEPTPHLQACADKCNDHNQCEDYLMCCFSGCGLECMEPDDPSAKPGK
ncbi:unnamed protein product [Knipowitschia caucasica]|uniref:WAP domain-containing protein n=1 Tax=Knipowitschia caucasica TaxID=637954 RepID=A0AAV2LXV4_KNICA